MQKNKGSYSNLLIRIGLAVLGAAMGIAFGYSFVALDAAGAFSMASWELLESPVTFDHIVEATTEKVWAETDQNKLYCFGSPDCDPWTEVKGVSFNAREDDDRATINKNTCTPTGIKYPRDPRGNIVECARSIQYFGVETRSIVYYALRADGTIWVWRGSGPWYAGFGAFLQVISPFLGLIPGLLAFKNLRKHSGKRGTYGI